MKKILLSILGIAVSVLLTAPVYSEPTDNPPAKPDNASRPKAGRSGSITRLPHSKAGTQLNERGKKRGEVRKRAEDMRNQMLSTGQQGQ